VGAGAGVGIGLIAVSALQSSRESVNFMFISALALSLGGGALTYWLTRGFAPEKQREEQISSGALLNMHKGRWAFGVPLPMFLPVVTEQTHKPGFQITVPLAGGRW
jgi:membrane protein YqaA with SNARE-associated domain